MDPIDYRDSIKKYPVCNCYDEHSPNVPYRKNPNGAPCVLWDEMGFTPGSEKSCPKFYCQLCLYNE